MAINLEKGKPVNLHKGDRISLVKAAENMGMALPSVVNAGLGWDISRSYDNYDLDVFAYLLDKNDRVFDKNAKVYYGSTKRQRGLFRLTHFQCDSSESVLYTGDNRTGQGDGDDEVMIIRLNQIPQEIKKIVLAVNVYSGQTFDTIDNAFVRLYDPSSNRELLHYNLGSNFGPFRSVEVAHLVRTDAGWEFYAVGEGYRVKISDTNGIDHKYTRI